MIEHYKEKVEQYIQGVLTRDDLLNQIPLDFSFAEKFNLLLEVKLIDRPDLFEVIFWIFPPIEDEFHLVLSRWALLEQWHFKHEEIISSFQSRFHEDVENIVFLSRAIMQVPSYLQDGELKDSYIRKCFYALAKQPKPDSVLELRLLKECEDEVIAYFAMQQLKKLGQE